MADRDSFLIRIEPATMAAVRRWADDELRSVNGQIEFLLRRALRDAGRLPPDARTGARTGAKTDNKSDSKADTSKGTR